MSPEASAPEPASNEQAQQQAYEGVFGLAELQQLPGTEDNVQLAENYTAAGTQVQWENNPLTAAGDNRRAIITDTANNMYYLSGNTLYDLGASAATGELQGKELDEASPMPDLTVGGRASLFGRQREVKSVLIATEQVDANDPATANASEQPENILQLLDQSSDELKEKAEAREAQQKEELQRQREAKQKALEDAKRQAKRQQLIDLQLARERADAARREALANRPAPPSWAGKDRSHYGDTLPPAASDFRLVNVVDRRPGEGPLTPEEEHHRTSARSTNLPPDSPELQAGMTPGPRSEYGIQMGPAPYPKFFELNPKQVAEQLAIHEEVLERTNDEDAAQNATNDYRERKRTEATQQYTQDKNEPYVSRGKTLRNRFKKRGPIGLWGDKPHGH